jgi:hypothetical protein
MIGSNMKEPGMWGINAQMGRVKAHAKMSGEKFSGLIKNSPL